jgi:ABC-type phosphate transport system auxiliary subunit
MSTPTYRDLRKLKHQIDSLYLLGQRKHLGGAQHERLQALLDDHRALRSQLQKQYRQLDDAEIDAIRASRRAQTEGERRTHLGEVNRIRGEKRKLFGEG